MKYVGPLFFFRVSGHIGNTPQRVTLVINAASDGEARELAEDHLIAVDAVEALSQKEVEAAGFYHDGKYNWCIVDRANKHYDGSQRPGLTQFWKNEPAACCMLGDTFAQYAVSSVANNNLDFSPQLDRVLQSAIATFPPECHAELVRGADLLREQYRTREQEVARAREQAAEAARAREQEIARRSREARRDELNRSYADLIAIHDDDEFLAKWNSMLHRPPDPTRWKTLGAPADPMQLDRQLEERWVELFVRADSISRRREYAELLATRLREPIFRQHWQGVHSFLGELLSLIEQTFVRHRVAIPESDVDLDPGIDENMDSESSFSGIHPSSIQALHELPTGDRTFEALRLALSAVRVSLQLPLNAPDWLECKRFLLLIEPAFARANMHEGLCRLFGHILRGLDDSDIDLELLIKYASAAVAAGPNESSDCLMLLRPREPLHPMVARLERRIRTAEASRITTGSRVKVDRIAMSGVEFEQHLGDLLRPLGYGVEHTPPSGDFGADLIVTTTDARRVVVQAKCWDTPADLSAVQQVVAARDYYEADGAAVAAPRGFRQSCIRLAVANSVELWSELEFQALERGDSSFSELLSGSDADDAD